MQDVNFVLLSGSTTPVESTPVIDGMVLEPVVPHPLGDGSVTTRDLPVVSDLVRRLADRKAVDVNEPDADDVVKRPVRPVCGVVPPSAVGLAQSLSAVWGDVNERNVDGYVVVSPVDVPVEVADEVARRLLAERVVDEVERDVVVPPTVVYTLVNPHNPEEVFGLGVPVSSLVPGSSILEGTPGTR